MLQPMTVHTYNDFCNDGVASGWNYVELISGREYMISKKVGFCTTCMLGWLTWSHVNYIILICYLGISYVC